MADSYKKFRGLVNYTGSYETYVSKKSAGKLIFATITSGDIPAEWRNSLDSSINFPIYVIYAESKEMVMPSYKEFSDFKVRVKNVEDAVNLLKENKLDNVIGEDASLSNRDYVSVKTNKTTDASGNVNVTLTSTVQTVASPKLYDSSAEAYTVSGLATDGYVEDAITNALTWDVDNELLDMTGRRSLIES